MAMSRPTPVKIETIAAVQRPDFSLPLFRQTTRFRPSKTCRHLATYLEGVQLCSLAVAPLAVPLPDLQLGRLMDWCLGLWWRLSNRCHL